MHRIVKLSQKQPATCPQQQTKSKKIQKTIKALAPWIVFDNAPNKNKNGFSALK